MGNISKFQHQWFVAILIMIVTFSGLLFGMDAYGGDYLSHNIEIISITLVFINTAMIIVVAAILLKIEGDLSEHDSKVELLHRQHSSALKKLDKRRR